MGQNRAEKCRTKRNRRREGEGEGVGERDRERETDRIKMVLLDISYLCECFEYVQVNADSFSNLYSACK